MATTRPAIERRHPPTALIRLVNPIAHRLVARGAGTGQLLVLHYAGRRTGRRFDVPVGYHLVGGETLVLTNSGWRHNFRGGRDIEVTFRGRRQRARALLVDNADEVAAVYDRIIRDLGVKQAGRRLGLRINVDRPPTPAELRDAIDRCGLSIVRIETN